MTRWIPYVLVALAAGLIVAGVAIWRARPVDVDPPPEWFVHAESPTIYGSGRTPYGYEGLESHPADGWIDISWTPGRGGAVEFSIEYAKAVEAGTEPVIVRGSGLLDAQSLVFEESRVLGTTGLGNVPLPETHALVAGEARFEVTGLPSSRTAEPESFEGWWMVADALRRRDGAVRQSGLIYSPLLRDQSGFSDKTRTEATLILGDLEQPALQAVFARVDLVQSPSRTAADGSAIAETNLR